MLAAIPTEGETRNYIFPLQEKVMQNLVQSFHIPCSYASLEYPKRVALAVKCQYYLLHLAEFVRLYSASSIPSPFSILSVIQPKLEIAHSTVF